MFFCPKSLKEEKIDGGREGKTISEEYSFFD